MTRLDEEVVLADIAVLRELVDRLLDDGRPHDDLGLVAASMLLNEKVGHLQTRRLEVGADAGSAT